MHFDLWKFNVLNKRWVLLINNFKQLNLYENIKITYNDQYLYIWGVKLFYKKNLKKLKYNILLKINLNNLNTKEIVFVKQKLIYEYELTWISNKLLCKFGGKFSDKVFNDGLYIYDFENRSSIKFEFNNNNIFKKGIFKSKIISIFKKENFCSNEFYKYFINIKEKEGFYVFGGYDIENNYYKGLYYINLKNKVLNINKIKIEGRLPLPRIGHDMVFIKSIGSIIIYGGISYMDNILPNELIIYNIYSNNLLYSKPHNNIKKYCFGSTKFNDEIYLFGGLDSDGFFNNNIYNIKLNMT